MHNADTNHGQSRNNTSETPEPSKEPRVMIRHADQPGDLGWMIMANMEAYARQFQWNTEFEALVAKIVADFANNRVPNIETGWIAELNGHRVGCMLCVQDKSAEKTAKLRILLVVPEARGFGVGKRLVDECLGFARMVGYEKVTLWTNDILVPARRVYEAAGFHLVAEEKHFSFGKDLVGQIWLVVL